VVVATRLLILAVLLAVAGCGDDSSEPEPKDGAPPKQERRAKRAPAADCPSGAVNCRTARGTVIYVEAVDPDGEGDAHFVLATGQSLSAPGITVIDVERDMRPRRLPEAGDEVTAAGPVYRGGSGQRQIQATELHIARR
jgi:hypothetical protein